MNRIDLIRISNSKLKFDSNIRILIKNSIRQNFRIESNIRFDSINLKLIIQSMQIDKFDLIDCN